MGDRFVERPIPGIEGNLRRGGRADYQNDADNKECETSSSRGKPKGDEEFAALMNQVAYALFNRLGIRQGSLRVSSLATASVVLCWPGRAARASAVALSDAHRLYRLA
jgi:hypothetical protein